MSACAACWLLFKIKEIKSQLEYYIDEVGADNIGAEEMVTIKKLVDICEDECLGKTVKVVDIDKILVVIEDLMKSSFIKKFSVKFLINLSKIIGSCLSLSFTLFEE